MLLRTLAHLHNCLFNSEGRQRSQVLPGMRPVFRSFSGTRHAEDQGHELQWKRRVPLPRRGVLKLSGWIFIAAWDERHTAVSVEKEERIPEEDN